MKTLKIGEFEYELSNDSEVLGIIIENKQEYGFILKPNQFSLEVLNSFK